ncbi:rhomboid family intramembrane serine protease [Pontibacterium sp.]|uniref:rhomboid family intramembrane serine protease n=1 Tax=Pontibacterium sp. TaxID=2036026 RepID=UPI003513481D
MIKVLEVSLSEDLTEFAEFLWQNEIPHRILERDGTQQLWVSPTIDGEKILSLYTMWQQGTDLSTIEVRHARPRRAGRVGGWQRVWLTMSLILMSLGITFLIGMGDNFEYFRLFTMTDLVQKGDQYFTTSLGTTLSNFELWRLISPIFVHFSPLHILFNLLWVWVVGSRIEVLQGRIALLGLVLFSGVLSNLAQFYVSGPLFGGMSGVVFALLGYSWFWDRRNPHQAFGLPPALMGLMVGWLALGYTGVLESMGFGAIANTAHLVGLLAGLAFVPLGELITGARRTR